MAVGKDGYKRKPRNTGTRKRKPIIYMMAEGKNKTETLYFRAYGKDVERIIRFAPGGQTDPVNMVVGLKNFMYENDYDSSLGDKAYCLIDADVNTSKESQIIHADKLATKHGIQLIVSAPCFEYWYMCHFIFSGKKYTSNLELLSDIERHIPGYSKSTENLYDALKLNTSVAVNHAKRIEKHHLDDGYNLHTVEFTPSTEVYHIAEELGV